MRVFCFVFFPSSSSKVSSDDESRNTNGGNKRRSSASGGGGGKSESGGCGDSTCTSCSHRAFSGLFDQFDPDVARSLPAMFNAMTFGEMFAEGGGEGSSKAPHNFFMAGAMAGARHSSDRGSDDDDNGGHDARTKYMKLREGDSAEEVVAAIADVLEARSGDCPKGFLTELPGFPTRGGSTFVFERATTKEAAGLEGEGEGEGGVLSGGHDGNSGGRGGGGEDGEGADDDDPDVPSLESVTSSEGEGGGDRGDDDEDQEDDRPTAFHEEEGDGGGSFLFFWHR